MLDTMEGLDGARHPLQRRRHQRVLRRCCPCFRTERGVRLAFLGQCNRTGRAVELPALPRRRLRQARLRLPAAAQPRGVARRHARPRRHRHPADPQRRRVHPRPARRRPRLDRAAAGRGQRGGRRPARVPLPQRAHARRARPAPAGPRPRRRRPDQPPPARAAGLRVLRRQAHRPQPRQLRLRPLVPRDHADHGADPRGREGRHRRLHLHAGLDRRLDSAAGPRRPEPRDHRPPRRLLAADERAGGAGLRGGPGAHPPLARRGRLAAGGHAAGHRAGGRATAGAVSPPLRLPGDGFAVGGGPGHRRRRRLGGALGPRDPLARRLRGRGRHAVGREQQRRVARRRRRRTAACAASPCGASRARARPWAPTSSGTCPAIPRARTRACGWVRTANAGEALLAARFYENRSTETVLAGTDLHDAIGGDTGWTRVWRDLDDARRRGLYFEMRASLAAPDAGTRRGLVRRPRLHRMGALAAGGRRR